MSREAPLAPYEALLAEFPSSPTAELRRFADARPADADAAVSLYRGYLAWRAGDGAPAALAARSAAVDDRSFASLGGFAGPRGGDRVFLVEGARYDVNTDAAAYVALLCEEMDAVLDAASDARLVVLVDCRPHEGWRNPPGYAFLPLIRAIAAVVPNTYPERLRAVVVYPLPRWASVLLGTVTALLDAKTRDKIVLLPGETDLGSPCPEGLRDHVALDALPAHARGRGYDALS